MGKPIERNWTQSKGILKFFPYEGAACLGYLLEDVDVTQGDAPGTYVYQGTIDWEKVKSLSIADAARKATPRVTFYGAQKIASEK